MATTSTAESRPALSDREQRDQIVWYLRAAVNTDEAEALASSGYRALPRCGGCGTCQQGHGCNQEPAEQVRSGGRRPSADPRFVRAIVNRFGNFPRPVMVRTWPAVKALPDLDRLVLLLHDGAGLSQDQVAATLKISRSTLHRVRMRALDEVVRKVWES